MALAAPVGNSGAVQTALDLQPRSERYWLDHCQGFLVASGNGRIGVVDEVEPALDALVVRAGRNGLRILLIPFHEVALIDPHERRIVLHTSPQLLGTASRRHG